MQAPIDVEQFIAKSVTSDSLEVAFDGIDDLLHVTASMRGPTDEIIRNTVEGLRRLLAAMARAITRRIVLASNFSVYDWSKHGNSVSEDDETLGLSAMQFSDGYAQAKTPQEQLTRDRARYGRSQCFGVPRSGVGVCGETS